MDCAPSAGHIVVEIARIKIIFFIGFLSAVFFLILPNLEIPKLDFSVAKQVKKGVHTRFIGGEKVFFRWRN